MQLLTLTDTEVKVDSCLVIKDKIPDSDLDYSDHQPYEARMVARRKTSGIFISFCLSSFLNVCLAYRTRVSLVLGHSLYVINNT